MKLLFAAADRCCGRHTNTPTQAGGAHCPWLGNRWSDWYHHWSPMPLTSAAGGGIKQGKVQPQLAAAHLQVQVNKLQYTPAPAAATP
jgi:hypothetical protein